MADGKQHPDVIKGLTVTLNALESESLSEWEHGFVQDQLDRIDKFGDETFFSDKQMGRIKEIAEKHGV
jgi:hypothetical protein